MEVTQLVVETTKNRINVYLNDEYYFWLSKKEVEKLNLKIGQEITSERLNNIIENIVIKKAKSKALSLLKYCDRTEQELRQRLQREGYLEDVVHRVIGYVKEYDYLNDFRYTCNYIEQKKEKNSPIQIKYALLQKGIHMDILQEAFDNKEINEEKIILKLLDKKCKGKISNEKDSIQKLYQYFVRKGFNPTLVMSVIKEFQQNSN